MSPNVLAKVRARLDAHQISDAIKPRVAPALITADRKLTAQAAPAAR